MLQASDLAFDLPPQRADLASLTKAWRQAHFASQVAAEIGKSWAHEQADDSHSSFGWVREGGFRGLESTPAADPRSTRARLEFESLEVSLVTGAGERLEAIALPGLSLDEALDRLGAVAERLLGTRRQPARPAPDLPQHALAHGAQFTATAALSELATMYDAAASMIAALRHAVPAYQPARCWPHHFDIATLGVFVRDSDGSMTGTVGVGLTPPDPSEASGYWYVSPWTRGGAPADRKMTSLPAGRWLAREGALPMAVLPVAEVAASSSPVEAVAGFVADAETACQDALNALS